MKENTNNYMDEGDIILRIDTVVYKCIPMSQDAIDNELVYLNVYRRACIDPFRSEGAVIEIKEARKDAKARIDIHFPISSLWHMLSILEERKKV